MKKSKRPLMLVLAFILSFGLMAVPASSESAADGTDGIYIYKYEGNSKEESKHRFTFQWWKNDHAVERIRNRHHKTQIFELTNTEVSGETVYAYCSDFICSAVAGSDYKRINLEDSTYYNDAAAEHIRAIMDKGYWYTWTDADLKAAEDAANQWLSGYDPEDFSTEAFLPGDAEEAVVPVSGLTRDEALMATQLAIWAFANTEGDGYWMKFFESLMPENAAEGEAVIYDTRDLPSNVKTFRKYLIHQQARQASPDELVFTDDYFVTTSAVFTALEESNTASRSGKATYDVTVMFRLASDIDSRDQLTLTAQVGDGEVQTYPMTGDSAIAKSRSGYYSVTFNGVSERDLKHGISLALSGQQWTNGVCFYEAEPAGGDDARETSQNMVGKYDGLTPVYATAAVQADVDSGELGLFKYDATKTVPQDEADCLVDGQPYKALGGAVFDLYVLSGDEYIRIAEGLVSGDDGNIHVTGLPEGYEYYFKEVAAPAGYEISNPGYFKAILAGKTDDSTTVFVGNCEKEDTPLIPEDPSDPTDPGSGSGEILHPVQTGDYSNMMKYFGILLVALSVIGFAVRRPEYE